MEQLLAQARAASAVEIVSVLFGLGYAVLAVRQSRWCWVCGGISSTLLAYLAWTSRLPMQGLLQIYYVAMSVYGFWHWSRLAGGAPARIGIGSHAGHLLAAAVILALTFALAPLLAGPLNSAWPRIDTAVLLTSLLATWMVARVRLENWLYWIVIDVVSVWLYLQQGLAFVAFLYAAYTVIAVVGLFVWLGRWRRQQAQDSATAANAGS